MFNRRRIKEVNEGDIDLGYDSIMSANRPAHAPQIRRRLFSIGGIILKRGLFLDLSDNVCRYHETLYHTLVV